MLRKILEGFYNPQWWLDSAIPFARSQAAKQYSSFRYTPDAPFCQLMSEDWDNLVILDACRFDQFKRLNTIHGELQARTSLGSATPEVLIKNFEGTTHYDTVYVTANPMYRTKQLENVFHSVIDVWESEWDEQQKTVRPEEMAKATLKAYEEFADKRILSHFMQPHYPFVGESAQDIGDHAGYELAYKRVQGESATRDHSTVWELLDEGKIDEEAVWRAYDENLKIVLPHVQKLIDAFDGKTVVTSDHGNLVNERITPFGKRVSGHPTNTYTDELRKVPWLVVEGKTRKQIHAGEPQRRTSEGSNVVSDRLADLGYMDT